MPPLKNIKHEKFCLELFSGCTEREAALRAGYQSDKPENSNAGRLMHCRDIVARLKELQEAVVTDKTMSIIERKERLASIARTEEGIKPAEAIAAIAELNKMEGSYALVKMESKSEAVVIKTIVMHPDYGPLEPPLLP